MPIRPDLRPLYPPQWRALGARVRFGRANGRCQGCGRPHLAALLCLPDGRWFDPAAGTWRDRRGRPARWPDLIETTRLRATRVGLAAAHLDHDPTNNRLRNLRALCLLVQALYALDLGGAITLDEAGRIRARVRRLAKPVRRIKWIECRVGREGIGLIDHGRVETVSQQRPLAEMRRQEHQPVRGWHLGGRLSLSRRRARRLQPRHPRGRASPARGQASAGRWPRRSPSNWCWMP